MSGVRKRVEIHRGIINIRRNKMEINKFIDPKNPKTVGKSIANLGNHVLIICFIITIAWVIWMSYK